MKKVEIFDTCRPEIGLYTRNKTEGDEYKLLSQFIDYYCKYLKQTNNKEKLAVFIEPRIETGFPDVVFATYLPTILDNWTDERNKLDLYDLKLLSFLYSAKSQNATKIIAKLGFPEKQTLISLEKLMDAKLIFYKSGCWKIRKLRDIFSITKLITVEAKLNDICKVAEQTFRNTWFSSHSYALTNSTMPRDETVSMFTKYGIGLFCKDKKFNEIIEAKKNNLPSSYLSYQFNEWIVKAHTYKTGN
jgi:hypothetical protein